MDKIMNTERISRALARASPFFSMIIGLGISVLLFHRDYSVIRTLALPVSEVVNRTVKVDGKCYKYRVEDSNCENSS
jgi:hypothetical protein